MIIVLGSVVAKEGCISEVLTLSREHVQRSRAEPGCIRHEVLADPENPLRVVFVEEWQDRAALAAHFEVAASGEFVRAVSRLAAELPSIAVYSASPVTM